MQLEKRYKSSFSSFTESIYGPIYPILTFSYTLYIVSYLSKVANCPAAHVFGAPMGVIQLERKFFGVRKLESLAYHAALFIYQCDTQTPAILFVSLARIHKCRSMEAVSPVVHIFVGALHLCLWSRPLEFECRRRYRIVSWIGPKGSDKIGFLRVFVRSVHGYRWLWILRSAALPSEWHRNNPKYDP